MRTSLRLNKVISLSHVLLKVMNVLGQEVKRLGDEQRDSGHYSVAWDGKDNHNLEVPSGLYLYTP